MIRIAILEFPGTNCEQETARAVRLAGMEPTYIRWNTAYDELAAFDGYVIPGGFSYEDRSRSGVIAALDPMLDVLKQEAEKGKPVLGICNGAQILVESGMVPGFKGYPVGAALSHNKRVVRQKIIGTGFYNSWIHVVGPGNQVAASAFTCSLLPDTILHMPAAHAEGRFVIPEHLLDTYRKHDMIAFRYCDACGALEKSFPTNPNGSVDNIAALTNFHGNVMAIMPHPERTETALGLFISMKTYILNTKDRPASYIMSEMERTVLFDEALNMPSQIEGNLSKTITVATIITDNSAVSVERELRRRGLSVSVSRTIRWTIFAKESCEPGAFDKAIEQACASGMLFNPNKEYLIELKHPVHAKTIAVSPNQGDDFVGRHVLQTLDKSFGVTEFKGIEQAVLWTITPDNGDPNLIDQAVSTHIFSNPFSQRSMYV